ncbi:hypothetical protein [Wukongibacter sp. M2B1]|uniref:hypothetical protein n=1 Tax=Wukongibacter sp. M2B1 TaxID=3088895 RepID=UPI003D7AB114
MEMIYTLPFFVREEPNFYKYDLKLASDCFSSLERSDDITVIIYNQGCLRKDKLLDFLSSYRVKAIILGDGKNVGIAKARQMCFEYIWSNYAEVPFICEIHLDMIFPKNWHEPLLIQLKNSDEPMISPGILTSDGELQPLNKKVSKTEIFTDITDLTCFLNKLSKDEVCEGFVHPVIHKSHILKEIGGYDYRFLKGKQGFEDDSLLLGYLYYMGMRTNWRPKCCLKSWVYHGTMVQRMALQGKEQDFELNFNGLFYQYGGYGFKHLSELYKDDLNFQMFFKKVLEKL